VCGALVGQVFALSSLQHGQIKGSLHIADGVSAFPARCTSSSHIVLWQKITRPPFLQPRACCKVNWASQLSQLSRRSGGAMPYLIKRALWNSWAESLVPLMVEGGTDDSQAPVCSPLLMVRLRPYYGRLFKITSSFS
jgi:hypothetical protein